MSHYEDGFFIINVKATSDKKSTYTSLTVMQYYIFYIDPSFLEIKPKCQHFTRICEELQTLYSEYHRFRQ